MKIAVDKIKNWIFVTGVPRSGTTFVGKILSLPLQVDYIHEPLNPQCGLPEITKWYRYFGSDFDFEEMQCDRAIARIFNYDLTLRSNIPQKDPWHRQAMKKLIGSRGPFYLCLAKLNPFHTAAILKDPIALFLTEYLYFRFQVKPVIIIKHPASFVASIKRVKFSPSPDKISDRDRLTQDYFANEPDFLYRTWADPVQAAAAFWRIAYKVLLTQASQYPHWQVITHEQISQSPVATFRQLYQNLDLPWSSSIERKIIKQTQSSNSTEAKAGVVQDFKRNSAEIFETRRNSLSLEERIIIFEIVKDVALNIYPKESFALDDKITL
ncbi:MAG: sulfotransferase [Cyanobacteriota bacterium]|nr:sulfotransferase [Cyanobacteriota bacterium]